MIETRFIVSHALPSEAQLRRFPSLRGITARNQEIVESLYTDALNNSCWHENEVIARADGETAREALKFYNTVVKDGRYVAVLGSDPKAAADLLNLSVSERAIDLVKEAQQIVLPGDIRANVAVTVVTVGVAVTVAVVTKGKNPVEEIIIDYSGMVKV